MTGQFRIQTKFPEPKTGVKNPRCILASQSGRLRHRPSPAVRGDRKPEASQANIRQFSVALLFRGPSSRRCRGGYVYFGPSARPRRRSHVLTPTKSRLLRLVPFSHQGPQQACARGTFGWHAPLLAPPLGSPSKIAIAKDWDPPLVVVHRRPGPSPLRPRPELPVRPHGLESAIHYIHQSIAPMHRDASRR